MFFLVFMQKNDNKDECSRLFSEQYEQTYVMVTDHIMLIC